AMDYIDRRWGTRPAKPGFYPDFSSPVTGSGWIAVGPGYRHRLFNGHAVVDGSATISWRAYKEAKAQFELTDLASSHLLLGTQVRWQDLTQVRYFGLGQNSLESAQSQYRLKYADFLGYGTVTATSWLTISGRFGRMEQPTLSSASGPFKGNYPSTLELFA